MSYLPCPAPLPATTVAQFRGDKPAFANADVYPDAMISYWIAIAAIMLNPYRWQSALGFGTTLFVAHNCALEAMQDLTTAANGIPGTSRGPISSETPGSVSLSYAVEQSSEPDGGYYNLTVYGTAFIRYARLMGAGPIQLGIGCSPLFALPISGLAYSGPWDGPEGPGWGT